jgi:hypothetical protein
MNDRARAIGAHVFRLAFWLIVLEAVRECALALP